MSSRGVSLSRREQELLSSWERSRKWTVLLAEIPGGPNERALVANRLVKKKILERIGRGLYAIRPFRSVGRDWAFPALATVELTLRNAPHYVGGLAAFTLNRLTQQQHTSIIDTYTTGFHRPRRIGNARVLFHRRRPEIFESGTTKVDVDGFPVTISTPERTILDSLDQFHDVGGMQQALRLFRGAIRKVDTHALVDDALRTARQSTCQRLGVLLEREGIHDRAVERLRRKAVTPTSLHILIPGQPRIGVLNRRWGVLENDVAAPR